MKYYAAALLLTGMFAGCAKQKNSREGCFRVKPAAITCADVILQIQDPEYYHLAQDNWPNPEDGNRVYHHVFIVKNYCAFSKSLSTAIPPGADIRNGFMVKLTGNGPDDSDCIVCLALFTNRPATEQPVLAVANCD